MSSFEYVYGMQGCGYSARRCPVEVQRTAHSNRNFSGSRPWQQRLPPVAIHTYTTLQYIHTYRQVEISTQQYHTYIYTYIHTYYTYILYIHTYILYIHTYVHTYVHTYIRTYIHIFIYAYCTYIHTYMYSIYHMYVQYIRAVHMMNKPTYIRAYPLF